MLESKRVLLEERVEWWEITDLSWYLLKNILGIVPRATVSVLCKVPWPLDSRINSSLSNLNYFVMHRGWCRLKTYHIVLQQQLWIQPLLLNCPIIIPNRVIRNRFIIGIGFPKFCNYLLLITGHTCIWNTTRYTSFFLSYRNLKLTSNVSDIYPFHQLTTNFSLNYIATTDSLGFRLTAASWKLSGNMWTASSHPYAEMTSTVDTHIRNTLAICRHNRRLDIDISTFSLFRGRISTHSIGRLCLIIIIVSKDLSKLKILASQEGQKM